ncbi:hypothetical protein P8452_71499 [Trifolium repens]|nr:hypothetical protein P8452_71499 [Trifolium repens]
MYVDISCMDDVIYACLAHDDMEDLHLLSLDLLSVAAQSPIRRPPLSLSHIRRTFPPTTALTLSYPPHLCSVNLKPYHLSASRLLQRPLLSIFSGSQVLQQRFLVRLHCCIASSSDFARSTRKGVVDLEIEK